MRTNSGTANPPDSRITTVSPETDRPKKQLRVDQGSSARVPHVLFIIDQLCQLGGAERVLLEIVRRLPRDRFRCSVATFKSDSRLSALETLAVPLHVLPLQKTYDFAALKMAFRLRKVIREENVSVVHTFFETSDLWAAPIAKLSGVPVIVSSRRDMGILRARKHHFAYSWVNKIFHRVLAVSEEVRFYGIGHDRLPPSQIETLYNGVDLAELDAKALEFDERVFLGLAPQTPVICTLSNIRRVKGIDILLRTASIVCRQVPDARFLIVGRVLESKTMEELESLVKELNLGHNVHFLGARENPYPVLRASNVFCLPSRSEGFSNALIEAMGCGLPVVATRVGGNPEAVREGEQGFLVASEDAEAMARQILLLLRHPEVALRMGREARATVEARFSMEGMMKRLTSLYSELLAARNA
jgi:glycosyltransferase involved in cell wall biosynthesis